MPPAPSRVQEAPGGGGAKLGDFVNRLLVVGRSLCFRDSVQVSGVTYYHKEEIAQGGFSVVDLVEDPRTRKLYALKRILCHSIEDQNAALKEAEFHRKLGGYLAADDPVEALEPGEGGPEGTKHPGASHILGIKGSCVLGKADIVHNRTSQVLLLLPYMPHGTLHEELQRREQSKDHLPEHTVLSVFLGVCQGLLALHEAAPQPLAHRDLKTHNILLAKNMTPVIMDLGSVELARVNIQTHAQAQHLQDVAAEKSSMSYRPPELFQVSSTGSLDERTDIWSLGCLLYALCFFKSPYDSIWEKGDSVALAVQSGGSKLAFPNTVTKTFKGYSQGLLDLIVGMLETDISKRPFLPEVMRAAAVLSEACEESF